MQPGLQQKLIALEFLFLQKQNWCQKAADVGNNIPTIKKTRKKRKRKKESQSHTAPMLLLGKSDKIHSRLLEEWLVCDHPKKKATIMANDMGSAGRDKAIFHL